MVRLDVRQYVFRRDGFRCLACNATKRLTIDHILPQCKGGSDFPENLQTLCSMCNGIKDDEIIDFITMCRASKDMWVWSTRHIRTLREKRAEERLTAQRAVA